MEEANNASVMKNIKFVILSSQEDELRLVEEAKARECKRKLVDRAEDTGKGPAETGDSTNNGNGKSLGYFLLRKHSKSCLRQVRQLLSDEGR
jgi:hypothetical protein